jgi:hypothetical protein
VPIVGYKASDTSRASTIAQASDPDLAVTVAANATYHVDMWLNYEGGTQGASDLKIGFAVPASATFRYSGTYVNSGGNNANEIYAASGLGPLNLGTNGAGNIRGASFHGTLVTAASTGTFALSWAQVTSNATATTIHTGSDLKLTRIG